MADKKCFLDKDYTRRQFLKLSGKSLAGLALSTSMLSAMGVTEKAVAEDKVRVWAFPQGLPAECVCRTTSVKFRLPPQLSMSDSIGNVCYI